MKIRTNFFAIALWIIATNGSFAGETSGYGDLRGNGETQRDELSYTELLHGGTFGPVHMSAFGLPDKSANPGSRFQGRLVLTGEAISGNFREVLDPRQFTDASDNTRKHLPEFDYEFVQHGSHLIPVLRGAIPSSHPEWEYLLEPGRVWSEKSDNGYSRAAFPFALIEKNQNCTHNGVMSFLFKNDGSISNVAYQISSETCSYFQFDMWGLLPATFTTKNIDNAEKIKSAYEKEIAHRMPYRNINELAKDHPGSDPGNFAHPLDTPAAGVSIYGYVIDGVNYVGGCNTRKGPYPFCQSLNLPSYSTAKTVFGGFALLYLEKKYPGTFIEKIADYVPACKTLGTWSSVSFEHALDMTTGHYKSPQYMVDEYGDLGYNHPFFTSEEHEGKIRYSCSNYGRTAAPGSTWVYQTSATYLLGTAMNAYVKEKQGSDADIYAMLTEALWKPLNMSPAMRVTRRTYDQMAQPFTGFGLTYLADDIAKFGTFLTSGARIDGRAIFDEVEFERAMMKDSKDRGHATGQLTERYNNGFWGYDMKGKLDNCNEETWVPVMLGYGGLTIALMPNNTTYYMISDGSTWKWEHAAAESDRIRGFCGQRRSESKL